MAWYCLSYDLRKDTSPAAYVRIEEAIIALSSDWCKPLKSHWIIESALAPSGIIARLVRVGAVDPVYDGIVVIQAVRRGAWRRLARGRVITWMRSRIKWA